MCDSPQKKKPKVDSTTSLKRATDCQNSPSKRPKRGCEDELSKEVKLKALKRNNFIYACQVVSREAYFDLHARFHLVSIPSCISAPRCKHTDPTMNVSVMPAYAEETFMIEVKTNMLWEALDVCLISISQKHFLSAKVLKNIVEIMLNAHEDPDDENYSITDILIKCQQMLSLNFNTHPPCLIRRVRRCYKTFLTSAMDVKDKTFTNRAEFEYKKGIVKYCLNRLEHEMGADSNDEPLVNKHENIPDKMKQTVQGFHWQKETFEIYELLNRNTRIERLMLVLESIVELLKIDLAIWHNRHPTDQGKHIMRSTRPLMASVLWSDNALFTGTVNDNCRQIMRIFAKMVHLGYPQADIAIMTTWLNIVVETFYVCEKSSNNDYPNTGKYCNCFAKEFYKEITNVLPQDSVIKVIEAIQPIYMKQLVALEHSNTLMKTKEPHALKLLVRFLTDRMWEKFPESQTKLMINDTSEMKKPNTINNLMEGLTIRCSETLKQECKKETELYPKEQNSSNKKKKVDQNYLVHALYVTVEAYIDCHLVNDIKKVIYRFNKQIDRGEEVDIPETFPYGTSEEYIKAMRLIYQLLKDIISLFLKLRNQGDAPEILDVFKQINVLNV